MHARLCRSLLNVIVFKHYSHGYGLKDTKIHCLLQDRTGFQHLSELGKKGGPKGGRARMESLTAAQRKKLAQKAAAARWGKKKPAKGE
jgi:hypothetical protein